MLNISDILKKAKKARTAKKKTPEKKSPAAEKMMPQSELKKPEPEVKKQFIHKHKDKEPVIMQPSRKDTAKETSVPQKEQPALSSEDEKEREKQAETIYEEARLFAAKMMETIISTEEDELINDLEALIEKIINSLNQDELPLLKLFFKDYWTDKGYLYQHLVNVCILSLRLGLVFNYSHDYLRQLGIAAFIHDVGMIQYDDLIDSSEKLSEDGYNQIKKHPITGKTLLKKYIRSLDFEILETVQQEHERVNGEGYPYGLKKNEIGDKAKLIGLVDVYEAMMHSRPHRDRLGCLQVINEIITYKSSFEYKFLKTLIDTVGIFPIGTAVRLNTKEIGIVIRQHYQVPLRPVIDITHNNAGEKLETSKRVNLATNFSLYIHDCFTEK